MVDKSSFMTISEMAKQREVTTETLRHYDRIGLFKPTYIDEDTGYRYYSIDQYETLGTIKELRQLGMSLDDIKNYFKDRTVEKSKNVLRKHCEILKEEIMEKTLLVKTLEAKLDFLDEMSSLPRQGKAFIRQLPERYMISFCEWENDVKDRAKAIMRLEELIRGNQIAPILASNRIGACTSIDFLNITENFPVAPMVICDKFIESLEYSYVIPEGEYVCLYYNGKFGCYDGLYEDIKSVIKENHYEVCGMFYQIYQVDITVTSDFSESVIEIQVPVKKI
ncbi:MerR family transcriptional regulator [Anaerosporobacter sp.]|uniref:MerR family transcriptional regulator n=1 Tax=Anaerosporobacter sp. TaxID=1872529 RepID=UPI00286F7D8A|nr:MerR family transcriptional regulator [Anaerosporobacter sp.]